MNDDRVQAMTGTGESSSTGQGLRFRRYFTTEGVSPFDAIEWDRRTASIASEAGGVVFEQADVEVPRTWSQTATNIVASKYFYGIQGTPERETSVRQLISRVSSTIRDWGLQGGYFQAPADANVFHAELSHLLLNQMAAFNSPV
jgi:ribonucleoside-diphosphate reductase alpha chain